MSQTHSCSIMLQELRVKLFPAMCPGPHPDDTLMLIARPQGQVEVTRNPDVRRGEPVSPAVIVNEDWDFAEGMDIRGFVSVEGSAGVSGRFVGAAIECC